MQSPVTLEQRVETLRTQVPEAPASKSRFENLVFNDDGSWLKLEFDWSHLPDLLRDQIGRPGLWKTVRSGESYRRVFAIPKSCVPDDDQEDSLNAALAWAVGTLDRETPGEWALPDRKTLEACLPKQRLTITHRSYTRQIELLYGQNRLALRVEILSKISHDLPEPRLGWLRSLLIDAQDRFHLVRLGFSEVSAHIAILGEIDLTGVPATLLEPLISTSADALRWVTSSLIETADFLAEPSMVCRALEICPKPEP